MSGALEDVTVVSFAQMAQGPAATLMLADMGAEVIKIEPPGGERLRHDESVQTDFARDAEAGRLGLNTHLRDQNVTFLGLNRNKKSIELNLKDDGDKLVALKLVKEADVLVENFRPGVMDRLGFGHEKLSSKHPELIYVSASGYGASGPYSEKQGQDLLIQGLSGLMTMSGQRDSHPTPVGVTVVDTYSAMITAFAIVSALYWREQSGRGQKIETDLLSSAMHLMSQEIAVCANTGERPTRSTVPGTGHVFLQAPYGVYETADGFLTLSLSPVSAIGDALDIDSLIEIRSIDEAYENRDQIKTEIESILKTRPTDHWLELFTDHEIWCGPVQALPEAMSDEQVQFNDMISTVNHPEIGSITMAGIPIELSESPGDIRSPPPLLDEHGDEIRDRVGDQPIS